MNIVELLRAAGQAIATLVEGVGILIVAVAVLLAAARYLAGLVRRSQSFPPDMLRLGLGRSLALSLEFLLGADILRTAVEPTWDEIGRLAAIDQQEFHTWSIRRGTARRQMPTGRCPGARRGLRRAAAVDEPVAEY
jgi:uncharacterized membrane protein